jgi:hypothetical protein
MPSNTIITYSHLINQPTTTVAYSGQFDRYSFVGIASSSLQTVIMSANPEEAAASNNIVVTVPSAQTVVMSTGSGKAVVLPAPNDTEEKIRSFSELAVGWHYGSGHAPSQEMIATAIQWHRYLIRLGFTVTDAFPGANGEIMVTAYEGAHYMEVLLDTISTVSLIHERDGKEVRSLDQVTPDQAFHALGELAGEIWNTSGYFIQGISTVNMGSSRASPSRSMMTEPQSFNWPASLQPGPIFVRTYGNFIPTSGAIRLYSGSLTKPSSPRIAA